MGERKDSFSSDDYGRYSKNDLNTKSTDEERLV